MDCEQAANFISARIDGEISPADDAGLDAHLAGCAACRAALESAELQDAAMVRAFAGGRDAAVALAARVSQEISAAASATSVRQINESLPQNNFQTIPWHRGSMRWVGWIAAAAAGFVAAVVLIRPASPPPAASTWPIIQTEPIAHLALASGNVFTCPSDNRPWQPMVAGDPLAPGAKVRTGDSAKCELSLPGGSRMRLNSGTEVHFTAARDVRLSGGQIWSAVPQGGEPLRVAAGDASITTGNPAAQFDVSCEAKSAKVTVVAGSARVDGQGQVTTVRGGESLNIANAGAVGDFPAAACVPIVDALQATRWLDDLLVLLPGGDPELAARTDALLARIVAERAGKAIAADPGPVEHDLRSRGQLWAGPIARYARERLSVSTEAERAKRRTAARLLSDLATPSCVADLVQLLTDEDADVRRHTAVALNRLTGQTLGFTPERCATTPRDPAPANEWNAWWARNGARYPARQ